MNFSDAIRRARLAYEAEHRRSIDAGVLNPDSNMMKVILAFLEEMSTDQDVKNMTALLGRLAAAESNQLEDALLEAIVLIRALHASRAHLAETDKRLNEMLDACVPISDDRKTVFVDGPGFVNLDYNDELLKRAETAEGIVVRQMEVIEHIRALMDDLQAAGDPQGALPEARRLVDEAIEASAVLADKHDLASVMVAFTIERGRQHDDGSMTLDGTVALGACCAGSLTVSVKPDLVATAGALLTQPGKTVLLTIKPLSPGSRTAKACAVLPTPHIAE